MTDVTTRTLWRVLDAQWIDKDPDGDVITVTLQAAGKDYVVTCSGPKGMRSDEFIPAVRAAEVALDVIANGGDITVVNSDSDATFYTGDQRAN